MLAAICIALHSFAQTYPSSFAWPAAPGKDQKEQGPCHIFASVSTIETWYDILFGSVPAHGISQTHPYSFCGNANQFPSTTIPDCMNFFMNIGGVDLGQLPYASGTPCTVGDGGSTAYFANQIKAGSTALAGGDCGTPYQNCNAGGVTPDCRYRIANYSVLNIGAYTSSDQLKRAIMNDGPIPLWMSVAALHGGTSHAYCLYGWDAGGNWLMTDSWPGLPNGGVMQTTLDIVTTFHNNPGFNAYMLQNTAGHPAVYRQTYNGSTWSDDPATTNSTTGFIPAINNDFTISGPSTVTLAGPNNYSVTNIGLLDNPTVSWSYTSTDGSYVSFSPSTGSSTTATASRTGVGTILVNIKRPNGLCEQVKYNVAVHATNIPFTLNQTENLCSGTTRSIQYVASSNYPLTCTWTLHPPATNQPYTITNGCTFTMDFPQTPSSYGIQVAVTSSALPGAADGATTGGPAMSCTGHMSTDSQNVTGISTPLVATPNTVIAIVPNPATGLLMVQLPFDKAYEIRIVNTLGATMLIKHDARSATRIDVSRLTRGIYFIQIIDKTTGTLTVKKIQLE